MAINYVAHYYENIATALEYDTVDEEIIAELFFDALRNKRMGRLNNDARSGRDRQSTDRFVKTSLAAVDHPPWHGTL